MGVPRALKGLAKRGLRLAGLEVRRTARALGAAGSNAWLRSFGISTVIDVGANTGQFLDLILGILPDVRIHAFEPLPDCYEALVSAHAGRARFRAYNVALGDREDRAVIYRSIYSPSTSMLPMADLHRRAFPHTRETRPDEVVVRRLDDVDGLEIEGELLVKIDVQGYEDRVIAGGVRTLRRARVVVVEVSFAELYEGQALFDDVYALLRGLGFVYRGSLGQKRDPRDDAILHADAVFVRP